MFATVLQHVFFEQHSVSLLELRTLIVEVFVLDLQLYSLSSPGSPLFGLYVS